MNIKLRYIGLLLVQLVVLFFTVKSYGLANVFIDTAPNPPSEISQDINTKVSLKNLNKRLSFYENTEFESRKYSPDGIFSFVISRDGWLRKIEIDTLMTVAEMRVGIKSNSLAISSDGDYVIVGNSTLQNLVILNAKNLSISKSIDIIDSKGKPSSVSEVYNAPPRYSFIIALKGTKEIWEIPYSDKGGVDVFKGWAHDYRKDSGEGKLENWKVEARFPVRRIRTVQQLKQLFFDPDYINAIATSWDNNSVHVINLDVNKQITAINIEGLPTSNTGVSWESSGNTLFAYPNTKASFINVINMDNGDVIKKIKTKGKSYSIVSHDNSPYIWLNAVDDLNNGIIHIINKDTLTVIKHENYGSGNKITNIEFIQSGKFVLLSQKGEEGEIMIYNATTLEKLPFQAGLIK